MVYTDDEREEDVGVRGTFMRAEEDGEEEEVEGPPAAPTEEEEYE